MQKLMISDYFHKPGIETARTLHKLYNTSTCDVPSAEQIAMKCLRLEKYFRNEFKDVVEFNPNDNETMELCMLLDVDFEDVEPIRYGESFHERYKIH